MEITLKNQFITLWNTYFPQAGLPLTFQYSADTQNLPIVEAPKGHRCIIAQLTQVQRGKTLCMQADSVGCRGGKRYTNFTDKMFPGFECFLSHNEQGEGERYKQTPELAAAVLAPFGAGCASIIYHPYREQLDGTNRAVLGSFDPSARKCMKPDLLSFAIPFNKFKSMVSQMEESFLKTATWDVIKKRIGSS